MHGIPGESSPRSATVPGAIRPSAVGDREILWRRFSSRGTLVKMGPSPIPGVAMSPIDLGVIVIYVVGCTLLGARLGSSTGGLKGYFLGESNIPAWAVMISIVATETSAVTFLSVPGIAYRGDMTFL